MTEDATDTLVFYVNGTKIEENNPNPTWTLLHYLRRQWTKLGCGEGGCGACTVMVSTFNQNTNSIKHIAVNACLAPLCSMHGVAVTTVEGIGSTKTSLHPVQERIARSHGSQCGFCTPGIVMSMYTLLRNKPQPAMPQMESAFEGNLCRCTGYRPILDGFRSFTKEFQCDMGDLCCQTNPKFEDNDELSSTLFHPASFTPLDPSQEPIFPPELQLKHEEFASKRLVFTGEGVTWLRPVTLDQLLEIKSEHEQAKLIVGNTEVGVEVKLKDMVYPIQVCVDSIPQLCQLHQTDTGILVGASVTLNQLRDELIQLIATQPEFRTRVFSAVVDMLRWFAGAQVRNVAAIGGNIITASPISDLNPLFMAAGSTLSVASKDGGYRTLAMTQDFFPGYRKTTLTATEVLISVHIPYTHHDEYFYGFKQAQRRDDDISIVNAGMRVAFEPGTYKVKDLALSFGGMAPVTVMATKTCNELIGRTWEESLVEKACALLGEELLLAPGTPGGMESYRNTLTTSFFFKFYLRVINARSAQLPGPSVADRDKSVIPVYSRPPSTGSQLYEVTTKGQQEVDAVGRPLPHLSAEKHATGEAVYVDDMPHFKNELCIGFVLSTKAHANIVSVDPNAALSMTGVVDFISAKDAHKNNFGGNEFIYAENKVTCQGQIIGAILADTLVHAQKAAKAVKVQYEELPHIITIEQAIAANSYLGPPQAIKQGDVDAGMAGADHVVEGEVKVGGQEHFYMETQACLAIPKGEDGEMEIFSSTQDPCHNQVQVAKALGVPCNRITCRTKRMGGAFGGKETLGAYFAALTAIAAKKVLRPVRCMLDRDEDMVSSGTRHPFLGKYKAGATKEGKLVALRVDLYSNAGHFMDRSHAVMKRALLQIDNCYNIPNVQVTGHLCFTNISSNTAFRGFGGPQGMFCMENIMSEIADSLEMPAEKIRKLNLYQEGERTHYSQKIENSFLHNCWEEVVKQSNFQQRKKEVEDFNRRNRWKKRGICVTPTKHGIAFTETYLNQAGALIHVYTDGSVLLTHGGVEMGQGLHTKMVQVASRVLQIPTSIIHISETNTATVPNNSPSAASISSDLNGMAVLNACTVIAERLKPYKESNPNGEWEDWVHAAYMDRMSLSSTGFYKCPDLYMDWDTMKGNPFSYFSFGVACSEVEIDCLTGDHTLLRTDIVMDLGRSLNPAIDVGQIEGAFVQGCGLFTLEEIRMSPTGYRFSRGPGVYKIPGFTDIPIDFKVTLLKHANNPKAVYSSKAVGEPPLFLAASAFFAIKEAVKAARKEAGVEGSFRFDSPATSERIRMACDDLFTKQFPKPEPGTYNPWVVEL